MILAETSDGEKVSGTLLVEPVEPDQQLEASLAWWWGNPSCEA